MRILKFNITGQKLEKDSSCDFTKIVMGSKGYLQAAFSFDSDWTAMKKAAEFSVRINGKEEIYPVLIRDGTCDIPPEVTDRRHWTVRIIGKNGSTRLQTNKVRVTQEE